MTLPGTQSEQKIATKPESLLPGLPAASYFFADLLDDPEQFDVPYQQRKRYNREFGFCLFTAECIFSGGVLQR